MITRFEIKQIESRNKGDEYVIHFVANGQQHRVEMFKEDLRLLIQTIDNAIL
jgi:hypothetical protein